VAPVLPNPFSTLAPSRVVETAAAPSLSDPLVAAADNLYGIGPCMIVDLPIVRAENERRRFVLDEGRFYEAIEPLPIFLQTPRDIADIFARY
jgi:hypothetical protein